MTGPQKKQPTVIDGYTIEEVGDGHSPDHRPGRGQAPRHRRETRLARWQAFKKMMDADANAPKHPAFDGSNIPGYNPETGMVERQGSAC